MGGDNPWEEWANSAEGPNGELLSGWLVENNHLSARVPEEHSETTYLTTQSINFIEGAGEKTWLCHLSYIKPHWPYLAPALVIPALTDHNRWAHSRHPIDMMRPV